MSYKINRKKSSAFTKMKQIEKRLKQSDKQSWEYGVFEESGMHPSGFSYHNLAAYLHGGDATRNLPPRPFMSLNQMWNGERYRQTFVKMYSQGLLSNKKIPMSTFLNDVVKTVGTMEVNGAKGFFGSSFLPPNAKNTIRQKGKNAPLLDTGSLRDKICIKWNGELIYT